MLKSTIEPSLRFARPLVAVKISWLAQESAATQNCENAEPFDGLTSSWIIENMGWSIACRRPKRSLTARALISDGWRQTAFMSTSRSWRLKKYR